MASPPARFYSARNIRRIRRAIGARLALPDDLPGGWTRSPVAVDDALAAVPSLRLATGWTLRGYVFRSGGNGNGIVWALPSDAGFPDPAGCPKLEEHFLAPPKPESGVDPSEVVEGDGSLRSYLDAAILQEELGEFGALWHGESWGVCSVCDAPPEEGAGWTMVGDAPIEWRPRVEMGDDGTAVVEFVVLDPVSVQKLSRYRFRFPGGGYDAEVSVDRLADGRHGIIF